MGSFSGVPEGAYRAAMKLDEVLNDTFINKMRMCKRSVERSLPHRYEQVVLAVAVALDNLKRKVLSVCDTEQGSLIEAELPINYLYIFIAVDRGLLKFEIVDQGPSATLVRATSEVIGISLVRKDWGRGRRNMEAVLDKASQYLKMMGNPF